MNRPLSKLYCGGKLFRRDGARILIYGCVDFCSALYFSSHRFGKRSNKKRLVRYLLCLLTALLLQETFAAKSANIDPYNQVKLQRGAKLFMNYCSGCHSLRYLRYSRLARDLGLTDFTGKIDTDLLQSNLIFTSAKTEDPIAVSMPTTDARRWFGIVPPDLTLSARERGGEWIYRYLKAFYADSSRPFGANNSLIPETAMPNVLYPLWQQGQNNALYQHQYERDLEDLVSFLVYVAEPAQLIRYRMGFVVILFLCVLSVLAYLLKISYWKDA